MNSKLLGAARDGDTDFIRQAMHDGYDVNQTDDHGRTPLMKAAKYGHLSTVKFLLEQTETDANQRDNRGTTALYWAVVNHHKDVVSFLIENGADPMVIDDRGWTALDHARATNDPGIAALVEQALQSQV